VARTCSPACRVMVARCPRVCSCTAPSPLSPVTAADPIGYTASAPRTRRSASYTLLRPERAAAAACSTAVWGSTNSCTEARVTPMQRTPTDSTSNLRSPSLTAVGARNTSSSTTLPAPASPLLGVSATGSTLTPSTLAPRSPRPRVNPASAPGRSTSRARIRHIGPVSTSSAQSMTTPCAGGVADGSAPRCRQVSNPGAAAATLVMIPGVTRRRHRSQGRNSVGASGKHSDCRLSRNATTRGHSPRAEQLEASR